MKNTIKFFIFCLLIFTANIFTNPQRSPAEIYSINVSISGAQEVPPTISAGTGNLTGSYNDSTNVLNVNITFSGLLFTTNSAHFHGASAPGVNSTIQIPITGFPRDVTSGKFANSYVLTAAQEIQFLGGLWYINIHTDGYFGGEIRGQLFHSALPAYSLIIDSLKTATINSPDDAFEFGVYLTHNNPSVPFYFSASQLFFSFNPAVVSCNPSDSVNCLKLSIVESQLPAQYAPRNPSIGTAVNPSALLMRLEINQLQGVPGLNISGASNLLIAKVRLRKKNGSFNPVSLNLGWRNPPVQAFSSRVFAYIGTTSAEITTPRNHTIQNPTILKTRLSIEGFYNPGINETVRDTVTIEFRETISPYAVTYTTKRFLTSAGDIEPLLIDGSPKYIIIKHRNSIETWSAAPVVFQKNDTTFYDFSAASSQAFGNNMKLVDDSPVTYANYAGDVNQDGVIDAPDLSLSDNDAFNFVAGYVTTDVNGDNVVDGIDLALIDNNVFNFVSAIKP